MKRIGKATGATINDVLMASLAGALRRYLLTRDGRVPADLNIRGVVPVNLRPIEEAYHLGNQFGLVFLALPLGIDDPLERVFEVRRRMTAIKRSPEAVVAFQILRVLGLAPKQLFDLAVNLFGMKATAVVTNVIGPRTPIRFAGVPMRQAMFWVPCAGHLGLGVSLLSYAQNVWLGVQTDAGLVPDPDTLMQGFYDEIEELSRLERAAHDRPDAVEAGAPDAGGPRVSKGEGAGTGPAPAVPVAVDVARAGRRTRAAPRAQATRAAGAKTWRQDAGPRVTGTRTPLRTAGHRGRS